jgi:hypothetical protein
VSGSEGASPTDDDVLELERRGWKALSTPGAAGGFYGRVLADDVRFLLPGGVLVDDRQAIVESMAGPPWSSYELSSERVHHLGDGSRAVTYRGAAIRDGVGYEALFSSTYVATPDGWRLVLHQQTPV